MTAASRALGVAALLAMAVAGCGSTAPVGRLAGPEPTSAGPSRSQGRTVAPLTSASGTASTLPSTQFVVRLSPLHLPVPTTRGVAFLSGTSILLAGGLTSAGTTGATVRIPVDGGATRTIGRLRHPVHDAAGVALRGLELVLGGGATTQDAWVQRLVVGDATSAVSGRLPVARADLAAVVVDSEAIVVGGGAGGRADPRVLATSDGVHFRVIARLPVAVRYAAVAAVGGRVFVVGGSSSTGEVSTIQVVDVQAGTVAVVGQLPRAISHATALAVGGSILVAGGRHAGRALDTVLAVDPATLAVRTVGHLPRVLSDAAGVVVDGIGYLVGGEAARALSSIVTIAAL